MFISYSQNFEDVILNRIFKDKESGFYIDIGAHHPVYDSVTKAFYDRGWRGINIEPAREFFDRLQQDRPRDINLQIAAGEEKAKLEFFELQGSGFSTLDKDSAIQLATEHELPLSCYEVSIVPLAEICREYCHVPIDFLKIDVEGWEERVIVGNDWESFRPTVIIVESTLPNSPIRRETNISQFLQEKGYQLVYFDGLNDYFLAEESQDLIGHFQTPPNVFDEFTIFRVSDLQEQILHLNHHIQAREEELVNLSRALENERSEKNRLSSEIARLSSEIARLSSEMARLSSEIAHLSKELIISNQNLEDERFETKRLEKELEKLQILKDNQIQYFHDRVSEMQNLVSRSRHEILAIQTEYNQAQDERDRATERIAAMESSKFWKLRCLWFRLRKYWGIPGD